MIGCFGLFDGVVESWCCSSCDNVSSQSVEFNPHDPPYLFIFETLLGLLLGPCESSVVIMGFRSCPFLRFFPPLPLAALFAAVATCLALFIAAFFMSFPFMIQRGCRCGVEEGDRNHKDL